MGDRSKSAHIQAIYSNHFYPYYIMNDGWVSDEVYICVLQLYTFNRCASIQVITSYFFTIVDNHNLVSMAFKATTNA